MRTNIKHVKWPLLAGLLVGILSMLLTVGWALAASGPAGDISQEPQASPTPHPDTEGKTCKDCHLDITTSWEQSPHAHAFDDTNFQASWRGLGAKGDCLLCHTTNYQATNGSYDMEGVSCEACHGQVDPTHPPAPAPIRADTDYCGTCHTTTLGEWRLTGHATAGVGCTDCHDPHSQKALFEDPDQMCVNCHKDSMGPYLEDLHGKKGIGCVDCHALVVPPAQPPEDGIVPTGHTFTISPATCVACHTDALHAGFSLPGYEKGARQAAQGSITPAEETAVLTADSLVQSPEERIQALESQLQILTANNASRGMTVLFQGGIVGLVLGGSTAWVVANNVRRGRKEEDEGENE